MRIADALRVALVILLAVVFIAGVSIGFVNLVSVHFDYLFGAIDISLIALLLIVFAFAVLLTLLVCGVKLLAINNELRRTRKQLRDAETELKSLRNLPPVLAASAAALTPPR